METQPASAGPKLVLTIPQAGTGTTRPGTKNSMQVSLTIGGDSGATSVTADISH
jgi:hypothetical protein